MALVLVSTNVRAALGKKMKAKGIYRDAVRSSHSHFVKCSGPRWINLMRLAPVLGSARLGAACAYRFSPSNGTVRQRGIRHKKLTDWARQIAALLRCRLPERQIAIAADSGDSALYFLQAANTRHAPSRLYTSAFGRGLVRARTAQKAGAGATRPQREGGYPPTTCSNDLKTAWHSVSVTWYEGTERRLEIASGTTVWYHTGKPPVAVRWVLIRDPKGEVIPRPCYVPTLQPLRSKSSNGSFSAGSWR